MTRVDFYILQDDKHSSLQTFACRLADKAYHQGHRILIQTENAQQSQMLDDLLWTFSDGSFLPHAVYSTDTGCDEHPIVISHETSSNGNFQTLINLSAITPDNTNHFERIAEILNQEPARKQIGRQHYKMYKDQGYELHHHEM